MSWWVEAAKGSRAEFQAKAQEETPRMNAQAQPFVNYKLGNKTSDKLSRPHSLKGS